MIGKNVERGPTADLHCGDASSAGSAVRTGNNHK